MNIVVAIPKIEDDTKRGEGWGIMHLVLMGYGVTHNVTHVPVHKNEKGEWMWEDRAVSPGEEIRFEEVAS